MISLKATQDLYDYVEDRLKSGEVRGQAFHELFKVRGLLTEILSEHYVKLNQKRRAK